MTIEISKTALYVLGGVLILIALLTVYFISRGKSSKNTNYSGEKTEKKPNKKDERAEAEAKRREQAAKRIEAKIEQDKNDQFTFFKRYISDLEKHIIPADKKIFFSIDKNSDTNPSYVFDTLRSVFKLPEYKTVFFCRRNSSTFGSDDYFIITKEGFRFGDSSEKWNLPFDYIKRVDVESFFVTFYDYSDNILENLDFDYILYNGSMKERSDFIDDTNRFLKKHKTEEDILINAALEAADEKAIPLLSRLTEQLGVDSPHKRFIRASYYYVLAEDGVNVSHNLDLCNYEINDIEAEVQKFKDGTDFKSNYLYGMCEVLRVKTAILYGMDMFDVEQSIKELMGSEYDESVRDEAKRLLTEIKTNN